MYIHCSSSFWFRLVADLIQHVIEVERLFDATRVMGWISRKDIKVSRYANSVNNLMDSLETRCTVPGNSEKQEFVKSHWSLGHHSTLGTTFPVNCVLVGLQF